MRKRFPALLASLFCIAYATAQQPLSEGWWRASLLRQDSNHIVFNFECRYQAGKPVWYVRNVTERIAVTDIQRHGDSLIVRMPLFESSFFLEIQNRNTLRGTWVRGTSGTDVAMPVQIVYGEKERFPGHLRTPAHKVGGRWAVTFYNDRRSRPAIAEFKQVGNRLAGTFLTPTGDYRFLEGAVNGDSIRLSTFDGHHAYYFAARMQNDSLITNGIYTAGPAFLQRWKAVRNENATLPDTLSAVYLNPGEERLRFRFPDLDSQLVSLADDRFRGKVVIVQLMGSWCANCMDETAFLSQFYHANRHRGIEVVALAYEYSTNFERSRNSLLKFRNRFDVTYPMLITGVRSSDTLRTEKTLPGLTTIKMLPTTIFIGKDGKVKNIHTGFNGPGTGIHYERFKQEFYAIVEELLKQ